MSRGPNNKPVIVHTSEEMRALWIQDQFPTSMVFMVLMDATGVAYVDGKRVGWYCPRCGGTA